MHMNLALGRHGATQPSEILCRRTASYFWDCVGGTSRQALATAPKAVSFEAADMALPDAARIPISGREDKKLRGRSAPGLRIRWQLAVAGTLCSRRPGHQSPS